MTEHGKAPTPYDQDPSIKRLGQWVNVQRTQQSRGTLSTERVSRLESIPGWVWDRQSQAWDEAFEATRAYIAEHGKAPSTIDPDPEVKRIGQWGSAQRTQQSRGSLSTERISRLESIPGWVWGQQRDKKRMRLSTDDRRGRVWDEVFEATRACITKHGRSPSAIDPDPTVKRLGQWCNSQRVQQRNGYLSTERISRLESIPGWVWNQKSQAWDEAFEATRAYIAEHGKSPSRYDEDPSIKRLGQWVNTQRTQQSRGTLSTERVSRLESIPGWVWDRQSQAWDEAFEATRAYIAEHGKAPSPYDEDPLIKRLGLWIQTQRANIRKKTMSPERLERWNSLVSQVDGEQPREDKRESRE